MLDKPIKYSLALEFIENKVPKGSPYNHAQWVAVDEEIKRKSFFSAGVENVRFLERGKNLIEDYLSEARETVIVDGVEDTMLKVGSKADFVRKMREFQLAEGMAKLSDFRGPQTDITNITSLARLNLIFDTNVRQAFGYGRWKQSMHPIVLAAFPAAEFIRNLGAAIKRMRHEDSEGEIQLKTKNSYWAAYQNDPEIGGFNVPWAPYGFNSYMSQRDVSRKKAIELGVLKHGDKVKPGELVKLDEGLKADLEKAGPELRKKFKEMLAKRHKKPPVENKGVIALKPDKIEPLAEFKEYLNHNREELKKKVDISNEKIATFDKNIQRVIDEWNEYQSDSMDSMEVFRSRMKASNGAIKFLEAQRKKEVIKASTYGVDLMTLPATERSKVNIVGDDIFSSSLLEGIELIEKIVHKDFNVNVDIVNDKKEAREYHLDKGTYGEINAKPRATSPKTLAHEIMHQIEKRYFLQDALDFLEKRTEGEGYRTLRAITGKRYKLTEYAYEDKFHERGSAYYAGKFYTKGDATELMTMGLERLMADPVKFMDDDPEYFDWLVTLIQKR